MALEIILIFILGVMAGGVVNLLADELPHRRGLGLPRYADGTHRPLSAWLGLSAFLLGQRSPAKPAPDTNRARPTQASRLTWRYPATEILTALLMLVAYLRSIEITSVTGVDSSPLQAAFWLLYCAIFMLIIVIDMEHKLILFVVMIPSFVLAILDALLVPVPGPNLRDSLLGGAVGFGIFFLLYQGGFLFTYILGQIRGENIQTVAFGYGDVMMMTFSGLLLGFSYVFIAMFITVFLGAFGAFAYLISRALLGQRYSAFTAIPYGPYIVIATAAMLFYGGPIRIALMGY